MSLHPQASKFLEEVAAQNPPAWSQVSPAEARAMFSALGSVFGESEPIASSRDLSVQPGVRVRVYHPQPNQRLPAVLYLHGGGWVVGDCDTHDSLCRRIANRANCCVASVDYRRSPEHKYPEPLDDCHVTLQYIVDHADELMIDPNRLGVAGDSAGGNLAAALALRMLRVGGPPLARQALIYPVIAANFETSSYRDFADDFGLTRESMIYFWDCYLASADQVQLPEVSPLHATLPAELPPALVITAEYDVLRDEGEEYARRLRDAGVSTVMRRYDGMLHGFVHFAGVFDDGWRARDEVAQFLKEGLHTE